MHYHIYYLSNKQIKVTCLIIQKKLKFATFLPNVNEAENPFPAPFPLLVYDMNTWFPEDVIVEGRVFPVKTFNRESFSLPPS